MTNTSNYVAPSKPSLEMLDELNWKDYLFDDDAEDPDRPLAHLDYLGRHRDCAELVLVGCGFITKDDWQAAGDQEITDVYGRFCAALTEKLGPQETKKQKEKRRELEETFQTALDDCDFDSIFKEPEKYKQLILDAIDEIAGNFCEGNEFEPTGAEPQWLLTALLKAGAEIQ